MKPKSANSSTATILFLTDPHLDRASNKEIECLLERIRNTPSDAVIVTGDISDANNLKEHLGLLAKACAPRQLYFLLGNHDYYGGNFESVAKNVKKLCRSIANLHHLNASRIIPLAEGIGLIGHGGWADARAGDGMKTTVPSRDGAIKDFSGLDHVQMLDRMRTLGAESAEKIRGIFPLALTLYSHVIVATHVPPFHNAVFHKDKPADNQHLPHFCNLSVGVMLLGIMDSFRHRRVTVLAGHSHGACSEKITRNLTVRVGASRLEGVIPFELLRIAN